ncbi:MAG TPA: hypothetical protein VK203_09675 [Nostocaceae cyanobacterium]|nr:hypothetical protein [Nostocaceae cyanobacterium]
MSHYITKIALLVELSVEEQQFLLGGQNVSEDPILAPLRNLRGKPVTPLGKALKDGSETVLGNNTVRGATNSGPLGSLGNSNAQGQGTATGAEDIMILPPFFESGQTL